MAERGGFEPPVRIRHSRFPGVRVKPLCHLSNMFIYKNLQMNIPPKCLAIRYCEMILYRKTLVGKEIQLKSGSWIL